jgi:hypothetical protein
MYIIELFKRLKAEKFLSFSFLLVAITSPAAVAEFINHPVFGENTWLDSTGLSWSPPIKDTSNNILTADLSEAHKICSTLLMENLARLPTPHEVTRINQSAQPYNAWIKSRGLTPLSFHLGGTLYDNARIGAVRCVMERDQTEAIQEKWNQIVVAIKNSVRWHRFDRDPNVQSYLAGHTFHSAFYIQYDRVPPALREKTGFYPPSITDADLFYETLNRLEKLAAIKIPKEDDWREYEKLSRVQTNNFDGNINKILDVIEYARFDAVVINGLTLGLGLANLLGSITGQFWLPLSMMVVTAFYSPLGQNNHDIAYLLDNRKNLEKIKTLVTGIMCSVTLVTAKLNNYGHLA